MCASGNGSSGNCLRVPLWSELFLSNQKHIYVLAHSPQKNPQECKAAALTRTCPHFLLLSTSHVIASFWESQFKVRHQSSRCGCHSGFPLRMCIYLGIVKWNTSWHKWNYTVLCCIGVGSVCICKLRGTAELISWLALPHCLAVSQTQKCALMVRVFNHQCSVQRGTGIQETLTS